MQGLFKANQLATSYEMLLFCKESVRVINLKVTVDDEKSKLTGAQNILIIIRLHRFKTVLQSCQICLSIHGF